MSHWDCVIVGAGAAGLFCAGLAGQRGLRVLLLDHAEKVAEKIRISGGGRCNFTNRDTTPAQFLSSNPNFCRSALSRYTPQDFLALLQQHGVPWHEKHKGQLFCDRSAEDIIQLLLAECAKGQVTRWQPCHVKTIQAGDAGFELTTSQGVIQSRQVVIATGGLSIPKIGATDFGHRIALQMGHRLIEPRPGLVPLTFDDAGWHAFSGLAGLALPVEVRCGSGKRKGLFAEDLLFTHRGLSGPAILQISSYWQAGEALEIDLLPHLDLAAALIEAKQQSKKQLLNVLSNHLPSRLAETWLQQLALAPDTPMPQTRDRDLQALAQAIHHWRIVPSGSEGWRKAEVTLGGVDTKEINQTNMESRLQPGLHFIGEVLDVTGWLGGYNFQWAWASAAACARGLRAFDTP